MTSLQAFNSFLPRAPKSPLPLPLLTPATLASFFVFAQHWKTSIRISFSSWKSDLKLPFPFHVVKSVFPAVFQIGLNRKVFLVKILSPLLVP